MNKYVRQFFRVVFQSKRTQQIVRIQPQHSLTSPEKWREYWQAKGFSWRTEPEIDEKRQRELNQRRAIIPNIKQGTYPFKGMKLSRADVEWLLATHENGRGPVDWSDESQREREGVDLRGADLRGENLTGLPLARMYGGLALIEVLKEWAEEEKASTEQVGMAAVCLEGADLRKAQLQGAHLGGAQLQGADLTVADLQGATLMLARLQGATLMGARLQGADLTVANLQGAHLMGADLQGADLLGAQLQGATLMGAQLQGASLKEANLEDAKLLNGVKLSDEQYGAVRLVDANWRGVNLTVVAWEPVKILGDEQQAKKKTDRGETKGKERRLSEYKSAVRANRQLATVLRDQELNEVADRFAYRAQVLQRKVLWKQRNLWKWLGSAILALLTGYGYRMWRILVAYLVVVLLCAVAYFILGMYCEPHLSFLDAVLTSVTAFHGRVFSEPFLHPGAPQLWVTAFEAVMGLVIEGVFIAMLTQKFFGK